MINLEKWKQNEILLKFSETKEKWWMCFSNQNKADKYIDLYKENSLQLYYIVDKQTNKKQEKIP